MPKKKATKRGGARPGAGRKPTLAATADDVVRWSLHLPISMAAAIDRAAADEGKTRSEIIRDRLAAAFNVKE